jgi:hypothetical protein
LSLGIPRCAACLELDLCERNAVACHNAELVCASRALLGDLHEVLAWALRPCAVATG